MNTKPITRLDALTFYVLAAEHPKRIVKDWAGDLWHAGCMSDHLVENKLSGVYAGSVSQGPNKFPPESQRRVLIGIGKHECWKCYGTESEPWTR